MSSNKDAVVRFDGSIKDLGTLLLEDDSVTTAKIKDLAVTLAKMAANSVDTTQLVNDAVTNAKIATAAVNTAKLGALAVTTAKLALLAVTAAIIAANAVDRTKLGAESLEWILVAHPNDFAFGQTEFFQTNSSPPTPVEADAQVLAPRAGNLKRLVISPLTNDLDAGCVVTVRINGVDTLMTVTVPTLSTAIEVDTRDVAVAANDLISIRGVAAGAAGSVDARCTLEVALNNS